MRSGTKVVGDEVVGPATKPWETLPVAQGGGVSGALEAGLDVHADGVDAVGESAA